MAASAGSVNGWSHDLSLSRFQIRHTARRYFAKIARFHAGLAL
jgi:hypothetical protein